MKRIIKNSFAKVALLIYLLGTVAHTLVVVFERDPTQMSDTIHIVVAVLTGYATWGFWLFRRQISFKNLGDKVIYWLVFLHLISSAIMHAYSLIGNTNEWLGVFKPSYSYFAILYFALFAYYSFRLNKRISSDHSKSPS